MSDPAPAFGRGGWVCAALLLGLFAGGGLTWAVLGQHETKHALVVYQVSPPGAATVAAPIGTVHEHGLTLADNVNRDVPTEAVPTDSVETPGGLRLPELRERGDRILRSHPKAGGCFSLALAVLKPFVERGFEVRDKVWDGDISLDEGKAVSCQLFKGNDYCFAVGTDAKGSKLSLQLYDHDGQSAEAQQTAQELPEGTGANATAWLRCRQTGTYFVIVKLETSAQEKVPWGMVSAYR